ncbi:transglutaminase-like domain-containing protein [Compostibacter hankyongensis]|uniref:Transglutaminase n=1 Tax=Compostibacter hankyongensis TaxID=1007089 RepID=A0ABP8FDD0_9BACT
MSDKFGASRYSRTQNILLYVIGILTLIPLAPYINRFVPTMQVGGWNLDLAVSLALAFLFIWLLFWVFRPLIIPAFVVLCSLLVYNAIIGNYSFVNVAQDYQGMVQRNWITRDEKQTDLLSLAPHAAESAQGKLYDQLRTRAEYKDSVVRNFAVKHSLDYFDESVPKYGQKARLLSLFRYINENFKYVSDARRDEYFATPRETILNGLGGDCDDHSLLMASCLRAIGGVTRIVVVRGHAYPELYCGDKKDFEDMKSAIIHLFPDPPVPAINYHENNGEYWINLDYTAHYPGGPYMNDEVKAVIDI